MANAIDILKEDHDNVRNLLKQLTDNSNDKSRQALLEQIHRELSIHTQLEEDIFYPAFRDANKKANGPLYHEALEEHHIVDDVVMPDVEKAEIDSGEFAGRAHLLRELVEHHVEDEEVEMFPQARNVLSDKELEELGERLQARRKELQQEA